MKLRNHYFFFSATIIFLIFVGTAFADTSSPAILSCPLQSGSSTSSSSTSSANSSSNTNNTSCISTGTCTTQDIVNQQQTSVATAQQKATTIQQQSTANAQQQINSSVQNDLNNIQSMTNYFLNQYKQTYGGMFFPAPVQILIQMRIQIQTSTRIQTLWLCHPEIQRSFPARLCQTTRQVLLLAHHSVIYPVRL